MNTKLEDREAVCAALPCGVLITANDFSELRMRLLPGMPSRRFRRAIEALAYKGKDTEENILGLWRPYRTRPGGSRQVQVMLYPM